MIIITMSAPQLPSMPVDDFEEFMVMDEYTTSNLRDMILQNRDIFGKIQKEKPKLVASLKNGFRAAQLFEEGWWSDIKEAEQLVKSL